MGGRRAAAAILVMILLATAMPAATVGEEPEVDPFPSVGDLEDSKGYLYFAAAATEETAGPPAPSLELDRYRGQTPMEKMLNATKAQIRDLDRQCARARRENKDPSKACELSIVNQTCKARSQDLRARADFLRKFVHPKGDNRKWFTKVGSRISRDLRKAWYRIGPVGRRILRPIGDEIKDSVMSGYIPKAGVVRKLVKRSIVRGLKREGARLVDEAFDRFIERATGMAREEGQGACRDEKDKKVTEPSLSRGTGVITVDTVVKDEASTSLLFDLFMPLCSYYQTYYPSPVDDELPGLRTNLSFDLDKRTFSGVISGETYFQEWSTEAWGDFRLAITEGKLTAEDGGHGWKLEGKGVVALGYAQTSECLTSRDDWTKVMRSARGSGGGPVSVEGEIDLGVSDYELSLRALQGPVELEPGASKRFWLNLADLKIGKYEPPSAETPASAGSDEPAPWDVESSAAPSSGSGSDEPAPWDQEDE
jgi:hypothetical protein